jgi:glycosyltransferase involved in cell wall biosynthesis
MLITVIVCTHNRARLLTGCLQSLADQTMPVGHYEVIVVESSCTDHTSAVAERFVEACANFRTIRELQPGKSRASNAGLRFARGTHVAFIDDDARAPRPWIEQIADAFSNTAPAPAVVAGRIQSIYERPPPAWWKSVTEEGVLKPRFLKPRWDLYRVCGSNLAFNKEALLECGGFAEQHGPVGGRFRLGEDTEATVRVAARYPRVWYDPSITVEHWVPAEKMTLRYLVWRGYLSGVAISEIEKTVLFSSRSLAALGALMRRPFTVKDRSGRAPGGPDSTISTWSPSSESGCLQISVIRLALRLAEKAGRLRGARLRS